MKKVNLSFILSLALFFSLYQSFGSLPIENQNALAANFQSNVVKAQFPGGEQAFDNWLIENFYYPEGVKRYGTVIVEFLVPKNGKCKDFVVIKAIDEELDFAAVEILKAMPKWEPATKDGKAIDSKTRVSVRFVDQESN